MAAMKGFFEGNKRIKCYMYLRVKGTYYLFLKIYTVFASIKYFNNNVDVYLFVNLNVVSFSIPPSLFPSHLQTTISKPNSTPHPPTEQNTPLYFPQHTPHNNPLKQNTHLLAKTRKKTKYNRPLQRKEKN